MTNIDEELALFLTQQNINVFTIVDLNEYLDFHFGDCEYIRQRSSIVLHQLQLELAVLGDSFYYSFDSQWSYRNRVWQILLLFYLNEALIMCQNPVTQCTTRAPSTQCQWSNSVKQCHYFISLISSMFLLFIVVSVKILLSIPSNILSVSNIDGVLPLSLRHWRRPLYLWKGNRYLLAGANNTWLGWYWPLETELDMYSYPRQ